LEPALLFLWPTVPRTRVQRPAHPPRLFTSGAFRNYMPTGSAAPCYPTSPTILLCFGAQRAPERGARIQGFPLTLGIQVSFHTSRSSGAFSRSCEGVSRGRRPAPPDRLQPMAKVFFTRMSTGILSVGMFYEETSSQAPRTAPPPGLTKGFGLYCSADHWFQRLTCAIQDRRLGFSPS